MKYFGTDGIRGKVFEDLTPSLAYRLGKSLFVLKKKKVFIAYDTRESCNLLLHSIVSGALSCGISIIDIGIASTPCLAYLTRIHCCYGVMITASHNPYYDNGMKLIYQGHKVSDALEKKIEIAMQFGHRVLKLGTYQKNEELKKDYIFHLKQWLTPYSGRILIDTANGATCEIAKEIWKENPLVDFCANHPNGKNINRGVGATHCAYLKRKVKEGNYDLGFAFDGDGDRIQVITSRGKIIDGEMLLSIFAMMERQRKVVLTHLANLGIEKNLKRRGIKVYHAKVGDRYVKERMNQTHASLGAEGSGHLIYMPYSPTGDGVWSALKLIEICSKNNLKVENMLDFISSWPSFLYSFTLPMKAGVLMEILNWIKTKKGKNVRCILRKSGTEKKYRVYFCASSKKMVINAKRQLLEILNQ